MKNIKFKIKSYNVAEGNYLKPFTVSLNGGIIALTSLMVISVVSLAIAVSISLLSSGEVKSSLDYKLGLEAQKIAESCAEEALIRLKNDESYTGTTTPLTVGNGTCEISIAGVGANRTINASATVGSPAVRDKNLQVTIRRAGNSINIVSWIEVE